MPGPVFPHRHRSAPCWLDAGSGRRRARLGGGQERAQLGLCCALVPTCRPLPATLLRQALSPGSQSGPSLGTLPAKYS